jgi:CRISPR/Cas system-associated endonuclease Cas1
MTSRLKRLLIKSIVTICLRCNLFQILRLIQKNCNCCNQYRIRQISILVEGVTVSSYITKHCAKKNIQIAYFDSHGEIYAALNTPNNILPANMQAQLLLSDEKKSLFITELVKNKTQNQIKLLNSVIFNKI